MKTTFTFFIIYICINAFSQVNLSEKYSNEVMQRYCVVCKSHHSIHPVVPATSFRLAILNNYFHQAHLLLPMQNDKARYTTILKALQLAKQEQQDTLFFF